MDKRALGTMLRKVSNWAGETYCGQCDRFIEFGMQDIEVGYYRPLRLDHPTDADYTAVFDLMGHSSDCFPIDVTSLVPGYIARALRQRQPRVPQQTAEQIFGLLLGKREPLSGAELSELGVPKATETTAKGP